MIVWGHWCLSVREVKVTQLQSSSKRKVKAEHSLFFFCPGSHLVFLCCFPPSQKEDPKCSWCCLSFFWFGQLSFLCVQQNILLICSPLCLFCSLFLILKNALPLVMFTGFPMASECSYTSLCLPSLEVTLLTLFCKMLIHCAWPCNQGFTKHIGYSIFVRLYLGSRQANIDSTLTNALLKFSHYRSLSWLHTCKNRLFIGQRCICCL